MDALIDLPLHHNLKINKQMKKLATLLIIGAVAFMFRCGPSQKELQEKQRIQDSITNDSVQRAEAEAAKMAEEQARIQKIADSTRIADSIAALKPVKKGKKK